VKDLFALCPRFFSFSTRSASEEEEVSNSSPELYEYISYPRSQLGRVVFFQRCCFLIVFLLKTPASRQREVLDKAKEVLGVPKRSICRFVLKSMKWNKGEALNALLENHPIIKGLNLEEMKRETGFSVDKSEERMCDICFDEGYLEGCGCGHWFCHVIGFLVWIFLTFFCVGVLARPRMVAGVETELAGFLPRARLQSGAGRCGRVQSF
jgi:hypothetical protein